MFTSRLRLLGQVADGMIGRMQLATSLEGFLADRIGKYMCGPTYTFWCHNAGFSGITFWGRPDEGDMQRLALALDAEGPDAEPHASLIDARKLVAVDLGAFNELARYVSVRRADYQRFIRRQALLRPEGLAGAAVAGFYAVLNPSHPVKVFIEPAEAFAWLGVSDEIRVIDELEGIHAEATGAAPVVVALRTYLGERLGSTSLDAAAEALGLSARNLQRKLREAQTTFQSEQNGAQVRVAQNLLLETNYDIKRIAIEVGCGSLQHFSVLFRKLTGLAPSQWRAERRPSGAE